MKDGLFGYQTEPLIEHNRTYNSIKQ